MTTKQFGKYDTVLCADSVEFCPTAGFRDICVCSTYNLNASSKEKTGDTQFYSISKKSLRQDHIENEGSQTPEILCDVKLASDKLNFAGILDAKWGLIQDKPVLGVGTSSGELGFLEPKREAGAQDISVRTLGTYNVIPSGIVLSLDWSPTKDLILGTNTDGTVAVFDTGSVGNEEISTVSKWKAHDLFGAETEVWIGVFNKWSPNILYTGADDGKMKGWDIRDPNQISGGKPFFTNLETNGSGVCSMQCSPFQQNILASGGYDGKVRIWDTRAMRNGSLREFDVGGGVWRLKWNPKHSTLLAAAAMRGGVHVIDVTATTEEEERLLGEEIKMVNMGGLEYYNGHSSESLAYGVDWSHHEDWNGELIGSCSFYDHSLHFWKHQRMKDSEYIASTSSLVKSGEDTMNQELPNENDDVKDGSSAKTNVQQNGPTIAGTVASVFLTAATVIAATTVPKSFAEAAAAEAQINAEEDEKDAIVSAEVNLEIEEKSSEDEACTDDGEGEDLAIRGLLVPLFVDDDSDSSSSDEDEDMEGLQ